ncbi:MAG TPA: outer membrane beta-barrel protein, partial [Chitinophagales bacterium]|nr:outer membrane beta-barrel protein [Chitinophagales bacterium]
MKARGMLRNGLVAAAFALVWIVNAFAQQPQSAARAPQGSLTGHVIDESSGKGLAFATVQVMRASDSAIVNGALTDDNGWFTVTPLPIGNYSARFGYVDYADVTKQNVTLSSTNPDVDAGNVALKSTLTLQEVVVTESRGSVTLAADRKIYNVGETAQPGQNANEVLQTLPSISQDGDGALQLRGNGNVTIMIDGRPVNSLGQNANVLEQINAESIERVEVITNPSAKFDPEGVGGIINVVLKKNKQQGVNGSIGATYGYEDKTTGTFNLNARGKKFNATFGAGARYHPVKHAGKMLRTYTTDSVYTLFQTTDVQNIPRGGSLRGGLDWFVNPRNTLSFSALAGMSQGTMDETVHYDFQDESENTFYRYDIENDETTDAMNTDFSLSYKKTFVKKGTELDASVSHLTNDDARNTLSDLVLFDTLLPPGFVSFNPYVQEANSKNRILTRQIDFVTDVKEKWKIETGYKQTFRSIDNDISYNQLNANREPIVDTTTYFNALEYNDYIFALYGTLSRTFNKTSVKAGVRGEEARRSLSIADQTDDFNQRRFDLFPSVFILQQLPHQQEVTLNYSRRINRPSVNTLNPFPSFNDPYSRMVGNP